MNVHCCLLDRDCRKYGAPARIYVTTRWGCLIVALTWGSRTQLWVPRRGYTQMWSPVVWHPAHKKED